MRPKEAAELIGCSVRRVFLLLETGELRGYLVGRIYGWRVRREEVIRWLKVQEDKTAEAIKKRNSERADDIGSQIGSTRALTNVVARG